MRVPIISTSGASAAPGAARRADVCVVADPLRRACVHPVAVHPVADETSRVSHRTAAAAAAAAAATAAAAAAAAAAAVGHAAR